MASQVLDMLTGAACRDSLPDHVEHVEEVEQKSKSDLG